MGEECCIAGHVSNADGLKESGIFLGLNVRIWTPAILQIEIIGIFGVIASLIFVGMQLMLDRSVAKLEAYQNITSQLADINLIRATDERIAILDQKIRDGEDLDQSELSQWRSYHRIAVRQVARSCLPYRDQSREDVLAYFDYENRISRIT